MTRRIDADAIDDIARGAAILGAGGGGDPYIGSLLAKNAIAEHGPVELVAVDDVPDDALVVPVAIMGAPTVIVEKPPAGRELARAFELVAARLGREVTHVACLEAGGLNSMTPIATAARMGLPLIDGDGMGRAFPELQMTMLNLAGVPVSPMAVADEKGNAVLIDAIDGHWAERLARPLTVEMGCAASIALYPHEGAMSRRALIPGTLGLARDLGALVAQARTEHRDAADALAERTRGRVLLRGKVTDVTRRTEGGFARGTATVEGFGPDAGSTLAVDFQNEFLVARRDDTVVATTPDLVCALDAETGDPITGELLRYGQRVAVVALPSDPRWREPAALELVGPRYFGYDLDHVPLA